MVRHKGAARLERVWPEWSADHPVAQMIATGDRWFDAWSSQACVPWSALLRKTGISAGRVYAIQQGDVVRRAEMEALAAVWGCDAAEIMASGAVVID